VEELRPGQRRAHGSSSPEFGSVVECEGLKRGRGDLQLTHDVAAHDLQHMQSLASDPDRLEVAAVPHTEELQRPTVGAVGAESSPDTN
jgi:hypothetical protein